jgi:hypothetical protein
MLQGVPSNEGKAQNKLSKIKSEIKTCKGYMTISFSYVYLKGLQRGRAPSSPVIIEVHLASLHRNI